MTIELQRFMTCDAFIAVAGDFLCAREAEHNLMLGLCSTIKAHPEIYRDPWFLAATDHGRVVGAAMQTPPQKVLVSEMDPSIVTPMLEGVAKAATLVPGVLGPKAIARAFADQWSARAHFAASLNLSER